MRLTNEVEKASREAWTTLTPAQKKVWRLCRKNGLSTWQAAEILSITQQSVWESLKWAEKKFVKQLEQLKDIKERLQNEENQTNNR